MLKRLSATWQANRFSWIAAATGILLAFVAIEVRYVAHNIGIGNLDYFPLVNRAVQLSFSSWDGWVNWLHPVGFSWLVRIGLELGFDAARFGQALSIAGGALGLVGTYLLALAVFDNPKFALVCQAFTAATGYFLYYAGFEGNDMLAAGLQILSLGALALGLAKAHPDAPPAARWIILAGLAAGGGYLVRYTGMITIAASLLVLAGIMLQRRSRALGKTIGLYLLIVVTVTALQWIPTLLVTGSPISNDQGRNVWFHVYGKSDFILDWNQAPTGITVLQVFLMNPGKFIKHWWQNFEGFWFTPEMLILEVPFKLFGQAGLIYLLLRGRAVQRTVRVLIGVYVLAHLATLSLLRLDPRFLLIVIPALVIGAVYFFSRAVPAEWRLKQVRLPAQTILCGVGLVFAGTLVLQFVSAAPQTAPAVIEASETLHAGGMRTASEVLSTDLLLQDLSTPSRRSFVQANDLSFRPNTLAELLEGARARQFHYLIYDREIGPKLYPALTGLLSPESRPAGLTPIYIEPEREFVIYRIEDGTEAGTPPFASLADDIVLQRYQLYVNRPPSDPSGWDLGLYLHWKAERTPATSFKVFIHVLDGQGRLVAQDDGMPVLWTYPTSAWTAEATIIDFHQVHLRHVEADGPYTLVAGLYDDATGSRLNRVSTKGDAIDDKIVLQTLDLNTNLAVP